MQDRAQKGVAPRTAVAVIAGVLIGLAGCATGEIAPKAPLEAELLPIYRTWFSVDVASNADLYRFLFSEIDPGLAASVDRVDRVAGGVRLIPGSPPELSAVARGAFPKAGTQFALTTNRAFERAVTDVDGRREVYFRQREGFVQLAVPESDTLYLSTGLLLDMLPERPPADLDMDREVFDALASVGADGQPDALIVFDDPGQELLQTLGVRAPALPLQRIDLSVTTRDEGIAFGGALYLRSETEAALFGRVGRFFVLVFVRALGLDSQAVQDQVEIEVSGRQVVFSNIPMSQEELVAAVRAFTGGE